MAVRLPKVNIPMTVDTTGVDRGIKDAERKLSAASRRLARTSASATSGGAGLTAGKAGIAATLGAGGLGRIGGIAGAMGVNPATAALAGITLPFAVAGAINNLMKEATTGAMAALEEFKKTGTQTFAANSVLLERLARLEAAQPQNAPTMGQAFVAAGGEGGAFTWAKQFKEGATMLSAFAGAIAAGKSGAEAVGEASLAVTTNETMARRTQAAIDAAAREREAGNLSGGLLAFNFFDNLRALLRVNERQLNTMERGGV